MKPFDRFIARMVESARLAQAQDAPAATALIQKALAESGLLPSHPPATPPPQAPIVDLNPEPDWKQWAKRVPRKPQPQARPSPAPQRPWHAPGRHAPGPHAPGDFLDASFTSAAGTRRYKLYVPARPASAPRPLVLMLHGCTQNPDDFATGTMMNQLAEEHGCLVLYPQQDGAANRSHCWNWFETGHQLRGHGEAALLADMTRQVIAEHDADPSRVFAAGLSAGGAMAAILGAEYPELYAAVGVHSGLAAGSAKDLISGLKAMKQPGRAKPLRRAPPVIVFHGDADHLVNAANGEAVLAQFTAPGAGSLDKHSEAHDHAGRRCTVSTWREPSGKTVAEHWLLHGAGHAWSGGSPAGSHTDGSGPSASREMLRFFLAQGR